MNRNNEKFTMNPTTEKPRSQFDYSSGLHTTFNTGVLVPIYCDSVLPGDTWNLNSASCIRMSSPLFPTMDNAYLDTFFFFVPDRLCWNRAKEYYGEIDSKNWQPSGSTWFGAGAGTTIPRPHVVWDMDNNATDVDPDDEEKRVNYLYWKMSNNDPTGSLIDYFGLPILNMHDNNDPDKGYDYSKTNTFDMLPFEAYNLIWNNFFRDQNSTPPCPLRLQDTHVGDGHADTGYYCDTGSEYFRPNTYDLAPDTAEYESGYGYFFPKPASKFHDYFTSALPNAQKGAPVPINVYAGNSYMPVVARNEYHNYTDQAPIHSVMDNDWPEGKTMSCSFNHNGNFVGLQANEPLFTHIPVIDNMYAYMSADSMPNVNDVRMAFALQRVLENDARGGNLYADLVYTHFGVENPDARVQLPEYLGGSRVMINMQQVVQTSETGETPQGNVSGLSLTNSTNGGFTKSFTEHGYIIGLCCVRTAQSYQSGIAKRWSKRFRMDHYTPELANISEQPIYQREVCCGAEGGVGDIVKYNDADTFGFNEAWSEYRYKPNEITGLMRSKRQDSLDAYHYGEFFVVPDNHLGDEDFTRYPRLNADFLSQNSRTVDRSLTFSHELEPQFLADFKFNCALSRCMPLHSVAGLIDHY